MAKIKMPTVATYHLSSGNTIRTDGDGMVEVDPSSQDYNDLMRTVGASVVVEEVAPPDTSVEDASIEKEFSAMSKKEARI
jgi:hypothetical protein